MAGAGQKYRVVDKVRELAASLDAATLAQALDSGRTTTVVDTLDKLISRCPTVSTFERMAFRHYLAYSDTHLPLIAALDGVWRRCEAETFEQLVSVLEMCRHDKCANPAKWPVVTAFLAYADPDAHVHIKPTTTRQLAARLGWTLAISRGPTSPPTSGCARWSAHSRQQRGGAWPELHHHPGGDVLCAVTARPAAID